MPHRYAYAKHGAPRYCLQHIRSKSFARRTIAEHFAPSLVGFWKVSTMTLWAICDVYSTHRGKAAGGTSASDLRNRVVA